MTNMNTAEFLRVVDHAAGMNDRWLFLAAFCLLLLLCGAVIYWLVKQLQAVIADHKSLREAHHEALSQIINTQNETALKLAVCIERTNVVLVTNASTGAVSGYATVEPVATNVVTLLLTNLVPVFQTNVVPVPVTNLVTKPEAQATIQAAGSVVNTFLPGIRSIFALALGGLYHGYRQVRNRKINEALIQGIETARAVLETSPQGQAADAQFVRWLMEHQKEAGVFTTVSTLVDRLSDNPAAKLTAQEILERVQRSQEPRGTAVSGVPSS